MAGNVEFQPRWMRMIGQICTLCNIIYNGETIPEVENNNMDNERQDSDQTGNSPLFGWAHARTMKRLFQKRSYAKHAVQQAGCAH